MSIFTEDQYQRLIQNGQLSNEGSDFPPVVKLFLSWTACTWLLSELDPNDPDIAFGLCDLGMGFPEIGYVSIQEIKDCQSGLNVIERDEFFEGRFPLTAYWRAAHEMGFIVTEDETIQRYNPGIQPK